jgi:rhodanese-related sulfurtransferase
MRIKVTPNELLALIDEGHAPAILDVRSDWEFKRGHVPGAVHIPFWKVGTRLDEVSSKKSEPLVVYCGHGPRAWRAGGVLRRHGFKNITYLKGHMHGWRRAGLREEKEG